MRELRRDGVRLTTPDPRFPPARSWVPVADGAEVETADVVLVAVGVHSMRQAVAEAEALDP